MYPKPNPHAFPNSPWGFRTMFAEVRLQPRLQIAMTPLAWEGLEMVIYDDTMVFVNGAPLQQPFHPKKKNGKNKISRMFVGRLVHELATLG